MIRFVTVLASLSVPGGSSATSVTAETHYGRTVTFSDYSGVRREADAGHGIRPSTKLGSAVSPALAPIDGDWSRQTSHELLAGGGDSDGPHPQCVALPDIPGAIGTTPGDIGDDGTIVGTFSYVPGQAHGYSLAADGTFTQIDVPGATRTLVTGINRRGTMVGRYFTPDGVRHGFLLRNGTFHTIDVADGTETLAEGIDRNQAVSGVFCTATDLADCRYNAMTNGNTHGFLLAGHTFYPIDIPSATYTEAWRSNPNTWQILGRYRDPDGQPHNFLIGPNGAVTTIDFPDAVETAGRDYTDLGGMNRRGDIVSSYCSSTPCPATAAEFLTFPGAVHGFVRIADGRFFSLDAPDAAGSEAFGINDDGIVVGGYIRANGDTRTHPFACQVTR
jgi:uncharacterized membrane protein